MTAAPPTDPTSHRPIAGGPRPFLRDAPQLRYRAWHALPALGVVLFIPSVLPVSYLFGPIPFWIATVTACAGLVWHKGLVIDTERRMLTEWQGPLFPLFRTRHRVAWFDAIEASSDAFDVSDWMRPDRHAFGAEGYRERNVTRLRVVAHLSPKMRLPEDHPDPITIPFPLCGRLFGWKVPLREEGRRIAYALGLSFQDLQ